MENIIEECEKLIMQLDVTTKGSYQPIIEINQKYSQDIKEEEDKKIRKKLKKYAIENQEDKQTALQKNNKLVTNPIIQLSQLYKYFQTASKSCWKVKNLEKMINQRKHSNQLDEVDKNKSIDQKKVIENLHANFRLKYQQQLKKAQEIQKEQQLKRKNVIDQLQQRIKTIQDKYQETGKIKIQKFRENQTLKHQLSKLQPHLIASESLYEAQIKKKSIQIEIQMTTLKQKIQMMSNFKNMSLETEQKLINSKSMSQKIVQRMAILDGKEQQHKILMAKAHLIFEDYKKALNTLKDILPKKQRQALLSEQKVKKSNISLEELKAKLTALDKDLLTHTNQLEVLKNLQQTLLKQLQG